MTDRLFRTALILVLALVGLTSPVQSANALQGSPELTTYEAELMDWNIQIAWPNFALQDAALEEYPHGRGERVYVSGVDTLAFAEIAFFDDEDTPEQTIAVMLNEFESTSQSFAIIDQGVSEGSSYALARFQISDEFSGYFYIEVAPDVSENVDVAQSLYTINVDFLAQLTLAREEISVAGNAFLGEPAVDLEALITADQLTSTPTAQATPAVSGYVFQATGSELRVQPPVTFDYPLIQDDLEAAYISSSSGFGFAGYMRQPTENAEKVIDAIFSQAPAGEEAPVRLHLQQDREQALAVYRIAIDGGYTVMVIEVTRVGTDLWQIEALAVSENDVLMELATFQQSVTIDEEPFLDSITVEEIDDILAANQP